MEKREKFAAHNLFKYKVTAVRLQVTKCFSAGDFANYVEYKFHFWLCQSALLIMRQHCRSCNSAIIHVSALST
jgi:hypothetical protein